VTVNGAIVHLGQKADPEADVIAIDGIPLPVKPDLVHYLVYKPPGVISSATDPQGRPIVTGLVPSEPRVFPVGRLDESSEGLLILTNDGELANRLTHPRFGVEKTYTVLVEGLPTPAAMSRLTEGVELDDGPARALRAKVLDRHGNQALLEVAMGEGRKREVRRMCAAVGHPVARLVRTSIGPVRDPQLRPGTWRSLTLDEVRALYEAGGGVWEDAPPGKEGST
jgi:23S rRNA pseudouridine2605 synthase